MAINRVIKILIYSDVSIITAFALYGPIFAIFIEKQITGGGVAVAGFAAASYWVVRSIIQLPIARWFDKIKGEKDDFWAMLIGSILISIVPLFYLLAREPWHIYLMQMVYAIGDSLAVPTYLSAYGRHVDKNGASSGWAMRSVTIGIGSAIAGAAGGILADKFGFSIVFILTSIFSFTGSMILLALRKHMSRHLS